MVRSLVPQVSRVSSSAPASPVSRSPLARTLDSLRTSLGRYQATFDAARVRRAELGPFSSPESVAVALDAQSSRSLEERYALVAAVVREHASHPAGPALWSSLLLVAFRPLLLRARTHLGRPEDTERDARVLAAFLDALARLRTTDADVYAAAALQRGTLKALARGRKVDRQDATDTPFDEDVHTRCEPHALTLGDACADLAWADAREQKLAALSRRKPRRARATPKAFDFASASVSRPQLTLNHATFGVSP